MRSLPFIDIHTYGLPEKKDTVTVRNLVPGSPIPAFTGRDFFSVGLHSGKLLSPGKNNEMLVMMEDALEFDHVILVGSCGINMNSETDRDEQIRIFEAQAFMAEEYQKPLIINFFTAYDEIINTHKNINPAMPWIFHNYRGTIETTKQLLNKNILFSFGDCLLKDDPDIIESYKHIPGERIFFETGEYDDIEKVYTTGAELRRLSIEHIKLVIWENFNRIENVTINNTSE